MMISLHIMPTISTLGAYTNQAPHLEQFTLQNQILCGLHCLPLRMVSGELQYKHTICLDGAITRHYRELFSAPPPASPYITRCVAAGSWFWNQKCTA